MKILVIDDDKSMREIVCVMMKYADPTVEIDAAEMGMRE